MWYGVAADLIVAVHVAYVAFVTLGLVCIVVGRIRRWHWVRNRWFRLAHMIAICTVAIEAVAGWPCPLTEWERDLRIAAGQPVSGETFIGRLLHGLIFYDLPTAAFTAAYVSFAFLVLLTLFAFPPNWKKRRPESTTGR
ncbi:MAG: DUF2784 domain-containing protein [Gemmataceae bacterium]|nr:DUF2784 domain-containing protein [Gemmataceae bacterium]